jgi:hypothetical protein
MKTIHFNNCFIIINEVQLNKFVLRGIKLNKNNKDASAGATEFFTHLRIRFSHN